MRTFIAIDLPDELKQPIESLQSQIRAALQPLGYEQHLNWTDPAKLHLTLRFLGETDEEQQKQMTAALAPIAADQAPFHLHLARLGAFPNWPRMRVLWTAVGGDLAELKQLQAAIEQIAQDCGFEAEGKPYTPHITLARVLRNVSTGDVRRMGRFLNTWAQETGDRQWGAWTVHELIHMRSQLRPSGAVYTPLVHLPFSH